MGLRGPVKVSASHREIAGTKRPTDDHGALDQTETKFAPLTVFPAPPPHLTADGIEMWQRLGPQLVAAGIIQVVDIYALEQLCYAWQRWRKKCREGAEVTAAEDSALRGLWAEFGLTPSARRRVAANLGKPQPVNRFTRFSRTPPEPANT